VANPTLKKARILQYSLMEVKKSCQKLPFTQHTRYDLLASAIVILAAHF
jgi:hypothetical protein